MDSLESWGNIGHHVLRGAECPSSGLSSCLYKTTISLDYSLNLIASFNLNYLPNTLPPNAIVGLSFYPLNNWQWGSNLNLSFGGDIQTIVSLECLFSRMMCSTKTKEGNKKKEDRRNRNQFMRWERIPGRMGKSEADIITLHRCEGQLNHNAAMRPKRQTVTAKGLIYTEPSFNLRTDCPGELGSGFQQYLAYLDQVLTRIFPLLLCWGHTYYSQKFSTLYQELEVSHSLQEAESREQLLPLTIFQLHVHNSPCQVPSHVEPCISEDPLVMLLMTSP